MQFDEYQQLASKTALFDKDDKEYILMLICLGIAGEGGEILEKVKHLVRDDKGVVTDDRRDGIKKEIGDVLWYLSQLARELGLSFDDIAKANIEKTHSRLERGMLKSEGDNR